MLVLSFATITVAKKGEKQEGKKDGKKNRGQREDRQRPELKDITFTGKLTMVEPRQHSGKKSNNDNQDDDQKRKHKSRPRIIITAEDGTVAALHIRSKKQMQSAKEYIDSTVKIVAKGFEPKARDKSRGGNEEGDKKKGKKGKKGKGGKGGKDGKNKPTRPSVILVEVISINAVK